MQVCGRKTGAFLKGAIVLCFAILFTYQEKMQAQVINNNGAAISINGAVITGRDVENDTLSSIENKGYIELKGNWTNSGTINSDTGKITFNGSSDQTITKSSGEAFYNFTLNNSGIGDSVKLNNPLTINGTANFAAGKLSTGFNANFVGPTVCGSGTIYAWDGTVTYSNSATQIFAGTYYNLTLTGASVKALCGNVTVLNNLIIQEGTLELGPYNITVNGLTNISGTLSDNNSSGTNTFIGAVTINPGGAWNFSGNGAVEFRNGLTHNGTSFNSGNGTYSFTTNNQNIDGTSPVTFSGNVFISANISLTNKDSASGTGVTLKGSIAGANSTSKYINQGITSYEYSALPVNPGILDASYPGNTFRYSGGTQSISGDNDYYNLVITGSGSKTFNSDINVKGDLTVSNNTTIAFGGGAIHTLDVTGNLNASAGKIDMSNGSKDHVLILRGIYNSSDSLITSGTSQSVVEYLGGNGQQVFSSGNYRNITFGGTGTKLLQGNVTASGNTINLSALVSTASNILFFNNPNVIINRTTGVVIGNLKRSVNTVSINYTFPVGTDTSYNPLVINFANLTPGDYLVSFKTGNIGNAGLPLNDNGIEVFDVFTNGYWQTQAFNSLASANYNITLTAKGFGIDSASRILKKEGGNLFLDGTNGGISGNDISRDSLNGISISNTTFAIGIGRPSFVKNPSDVTVCEGLNTFFKVTATGQGKLSYKWQVNSGSGFVNINDGGVYSNSNKDSLSITGVTITMNNYLYRCVVTDAEGHENTSSAAKLTVNPTPVISLTQTSDIICNNTNAIITPSSSVPGSTYSWIVTSDAGITGATAGSGVSIDQLLTNNNNYDAKVIYTIRPVALTGCVGYSKNDTIFVDPTPLISAIINHDTICYNEPVTFNVFNLNGTVLGNWKYNISVNLSSSLISGYSSGK